MDSRSTTARSLDASQTVLINLSCPAGLCSAYFHTEGIFHCIIQKVKIYYECSSFIFGHSFFLLKEATLLPFGYERPIFCHSRQSGLFNQWQWSHSTVILASIKRTRRCTQTFFSLTQTSPIWTALWPVQRWSSCRWCVEPSVCGAKQFFKPRTSSELWMYFSPSFFHHSSFPLHDSWHHSAVNGFLFRLVGLWPWHSLLHAVCYIGFLHYTPLWVKCRLLCLIVHSISFCNEAELRYMFFFPIKTNKYIYLWKFGNLIIGTAVIWRSLLGPLSWFHNI